METILKFEFNPKSLDWKKGQFNISNLTITGNGKDQKIDYENIKLYLDDKLYTGGIDTFVETNVSAEQLFNSVLTSFLRNDTLNFNSFDDEWHIFKSIEALKEWDGNLLIKLPVYMGKLEIYELQFAIPSRYYYVSDDYSYLLLDANGDILTDSEGFWWSSYLEDLAAALKKDIKCLYMGDFTDYYIQEEGEENIISEYY